MEENKTGVEKHICGGICNITRMDWCNNFILGIRHGQVPKKDVKHFEFCMYQASLGYSDKISDQNLATFMLHITNLSDTNMSQII